ncbi:insulysin [Enteropsectra breve]|nr:insulysin [Enteropsectra breve]
MLETNATDSNQYKALILDNGVKALLISNPEFTKSSCAVSVGIGSYNDPHEHPGLAHFLEHMLFMGTAEYPGENDFQNFLSLHNGYSNAYTSDEMTVYYCDIESGEYKKMIDMFASFFTCPLFIKDAVVREISAVNSEYLNSINSAPFRMGALLSEFIRENEIRGRFSCGNSETLKSPNIWAEVKEFYEKAYSGDGMCVVLATNHPIQFAEQLLMKFADIKQLNRAGSTANDKQHYCYFSEEYLGREVFMKGQDEQQELIVILNTSPASNTFGVNPYSYIEFIISGKAEGSLIYKLRQAEYAYDADFHYEYYKESTAVQISVSLTEKGRNSYKDVAIMTYNYLKGLRPTETEYERIKQIKHTEFMLMEQQIPIDMAEQLSAAMQTYPVQNLLNHNHIFSHFDEKLINSVLTEICDASRWIVVVLDKNGTFDRKEKYYEVEYRLGDSTDYIMDASNSQNLNEKAECCAKRDVLPVPSLHGLPLQNKSKMVLKVMEYGAIYTAESCSICSYKTNIYIVLRTKDIATNYANSELWISLKELQFKEKYARTLEECHADIDAYASNKKIHINIKGMSKHVYRICLEFIEFMTQESNTHFQIVKSEIENRHKKAISKSPYRRLDNILACTLSGTPRSEETLGVIKDINAVECPLSSGYYTEIMGLGSVDINELYSIYSVLQRPVKQWHVKSQLIPGQDSEINFFTNDKNNNAVGVYYEIEEYDEFAALSPKKLKNSAIGQLLHQIFYDEFFNELRTSEELGYIVYCDMSFIENTEFLKFVVQSTRSKEFLVKRIGEFVKKHLNKLESMSASAFEMHKESLINVYKEPILNLDELSSFAMKQKRIGTWALGFNNTMVRIIERLSKRDVLKFGLAQRKISVVGSCTNSE